MDVLYQSVMEARHCLDGGGSVGWAFWDIEEGLQNVQRERVLARLGECEPLRFWRTWLGQFMTPREFEVLWDGTVRGNGRADKGIQQGSPLSPILFLVHMAPILEEMERRVKEEVGSLTVCFPLYVDDLYCGLYNRRHAGGKVDRHERMQDMVVRVQRTVSEVAREYEGQLAADKE